MGETNTISLPNAKANDAAKMAIDVDIKGKAMERTPSVEPRDGLGFRGVILRHCIRMNSTGIRRTVSWRD